MEAFRPARGGGVRARFAGPEAALLRDLIEQVAALLGPAEAGGAREGTGAPGSSAPASGEPGVPSPEELEAMLGPDGPPAAPGEPGGPAAAPDDPALARLLPDAYRDDPEAAGEFRRYTEQNLRSAKQETARTVLETLPPGGGQVRLSGDQAQAWLRALNDVRLALGVRLGVTEEFEEQWQGLAPGDPRSAVFEVYAWLGSVQESLVEALL